MGRTKVMRRWPAARMAPGMPAPVPCAQAPRVTPTKVGSAKTASVNSSQQSRTIAASDASIVRIIMVVASLWTRYDGRAFHHHHGAAEI